MWKETVNVLVEGYLGKLDLKFCGFPGAAAE